MEKNKNNVMVRRWRHSLLRQTSRSNRTSPDKTGQARADVTVEQKTATAQDILYTSWHIVTTYAGDSVRRTHVTAYVD